MGLHVLGVPSLRDHGFSDIVGSRLSGLFFDLCAMHRQHKSHRKYAVRITRGMYSPTALLQ